jgi:hypothetical protein
MLNKMRRTLELLYRCAQCYEVDDEIKLAIIEVMERLIGFWVEAIKHLRKNPAGESTITWFISTSRISVPRALSPYLPTSKCA